MRPALYNSGLWDERGAISQMKQCHQTSKITLHFKKLSTNKGSRAKLKKRQNDRSDTDFQGFPEQLKSEPVRTSRRFYLKMFRNRVIPDISWQRSVLWICLNSTTKTILTLCRKTSRAQESKPNFFNLAANVLRVTPKTSAALLLFPPVCFKAFSTAIFSSSSRFKGISPASSLPLKG